MLQGEASALSDIFYFNDTATTQIYTLSLHDALPISFGGHTFKRLCHVGDRTGLEMIRTLQDRGVQQGIDVYMECTVTRLLTDSGRLAGAFARSEEHTSELQSQFHLVCRLLLEKKNNK